MTDIRCTARKALVLTFLLLPQLFTAAMAADRLFTWTVSDRDGIRIFLGKVDQNGVEKFTSITEENKGVTPVFVRAKNVIWASWVDRTEIDTYKLMVGQIDINNLKLISEQQLITHNKLVYAPSIMLDEAGLPWLAWTEFDGEDEEIFAAHVKNTANDNLSWSEHIQITDNHHPDYVPVIGATTEHPVGIWWKSNNNTVRTLQKSTLRPDLSFSKPSIANPFEKIPHRDSNKVLGNEAFSKPKFNLAEYANSLLDPVIEIP